MVKGLSLNFSPAQKSQDLVGIDLGQDYLKIAHVHVSQLKREVMHLSSHEIKSLSDEDVCALLRKSLTQMGLKDPRAFLAVPLGVVITRTIEIPSKDPDEIKEIVNLQASRHTPYSRAEIIIDTLSLGIVRENYTKVLLVIAPKDTVVKQTALLERAGLRLEKVFFSPEGVCQACTRIQNSENDDAATGIIHMDSDFTAFQVIQRGKILFIRGISIGAVQLLEEKEIYADRFVDELQKSIESYMADELGP